MEAKDWKDTVMKLARDNIKDYRSIDSYDVDGIGAPTTIKVDSWNVSKLLEDQAEISFNAGEKQGIRKVVEWVEGNTEHINPSGMRLDRQDWQAKLKEWGIEK